MKKPVVSSLIHFSFYEVLDFLNKTVVPFFLQVLAQKKTFEELIKAACAEKDHLASFPSFHHFHRNGNRFEVLCVVTSITKLVRLVRNSVRSVS